MTSPDTAFQSALELHQQGRFADAERAYNAILRADPSHFDALHLLGVIAGQSGKPARSAYFIRRALAIRPFVPQAHNNLGNALRNLKELDKACESFRFALAIKPDYAQAHNNLGVALQESGKPEDALPCFERALALAPDYAEAHNNRGNVLRALGRFEEALASFDAALALTPDYPEAHCNRGTTLQDLGRPEEALASYARATALRPAYPEAHYNHGNALFNLNRHEEAAAAYVEAVRYAPEDDDALTACAGVFDMLRRYAEAIALYDRVLDRRPYDLEARPLEPETAPAPPIPLPLSAPKWPGYLGQPPTGPERLANARKYYATVFARRGNALLGIDRPNEALVSYDAAIALFPDEPLHHFNRGAALKSAGRETEGRDSYARVLELCPRFPMTHGEVVIAKSMLCDWDGIEAEIEAMASEIREGDLVSTPFPLHAWFDDGTLIRDTAIRFTTHTLGYLDPLPRARPLQPGPKIRIGYFSPDLRDHPVAALMAGVFEAHDRDRFEIHAFSFGPAFQGARRDRIRAGVDHFHDITALSNQDAARLAHAHDIDIAVDLAGYTMHCRSEIFALRAAPVQVSYIGFLGTMGATWMDYLIADPVLVPEAHHDNYVEKIAYLPSYQANDPLRQASPSPVTRRDIGLPEDKVVFCSLNNAYKNNPWTFALWARIMHEVPDSVLWLFPNRAETQENLARAADSAGIGRDRLIFFESVAHGAFIARLALADLFLDTSPYNAGATASDALRAGLPLLTLRGQTFSSRLAASLLTALDIPELIAETPDAYVETAIALANAPERRAELRRKILAHHGTTRLFDTPRFTRSLEAAFVAMHDRARDGLPPDHIRITD